MRMVSHLGRGARRWRASTARSRRSRPAATASRARRRRRTFLPLHRRGSGAGTRAPSARRRTSRSGGQRRRAVERGSHPLPETGSHGPEIDQRPEVACDLETGGLVLPTLGQLAPPFRDQARERALGNDRLQGPVRTHGTADYSTARELSGCVRGPRPGRLHGLRARTTQSLRIQRQRVLTGSPGGR